jgi:magnesium-transporting ATPase (P-type)
MVTGDNIVTAIAISREANIIDKNIPEKIVREKYAFLGSEIK